MPSQPHVVDATLFFSPTSGGVRRYLLAKHDWLRRAAAVEHTLFVPGPRMGGRRGAVVEFPGPVIPGTGGYRCPWRLRAIAMALRRLEPDLIEAGDPYQIGWVAAATAARLGVPAVAFCHSDLIALARERLGVRGSRLAGRYLRALYAKFDLVLAPSRVVVMRLQDAGVEHAVAQPLGVDATTFSPERADPGLRASLGLPAGARLLVFAGRLAHEKNLGELYAMVERLGDPYHLLVIGGTARSRSGRVTTIPYQRDPCRLAAWLASADAHVHAGRCETFGLVALEAMACGLPVVAYEAGALPEVVEPSVGFLAPARGPASLAAAVDALFARPQPPLRAAARERVLREFTWDRALTRQLVLYAGLLNRRSLLRHDAVPAPA